MKRIISTTLLSAATLGASPISWAGEPAKSTTQLTQAELDKAERQQARMLQDLKKQLEGLPDSPRSEELKRLLAEIERRMQEPHKWYLAPSSKMTPEMSAYHARMLRKLEDCGTRNFPKVGGKSVYGKGVLAITLDRSGRASGIEIVESSGSKVVDAHVAKVVRASSPFGAFPKRITPESNRWFDLLVVVNGFEFKPDGAPLDELDEKERCRWR